MSSPKGSSGITVALDALHADASLWRDRALRLRNAQDALDSLEEIKPDDISFAGVKAGLDTALQDLLGNIHSKLGQGQEFFENLANDLDEAANQYRADDEAGLHAINQAEGG